ncbi:MAG: serine/threonine-protein kinase [Acidobacteria bacterium]|nr:serine/threonine-protein kinase [Acidobacteriota bacterium]
MAFPTGARFGPYDIHSLLGAGGMGEVYKAVDTRLGRTVALKVLADQGAGGRATQLRLVREAKASAALDHANICTVLEVGEHDGRAFLAMAFVDGKTLRERIAERPLKLEEALDIAIQAGQGLQEAHERGVVHRDVKPANLMVTPQGQVKLLDFGLARATDDTRITEAGTVVGTPAYMSPEQARGDAVDRRSDIWSLGVVLYEMLTGRAPFAGESPTALLRAVLDDEPEPVTALRSGLPVMLDQVLAKALAKNPAERYQHVEDLLVDLRALQRGASSGTLARHAASRKQHAWRWWAVAASVLVCIAGFLVWRQWGGMAPRAVMRFISPLPDGYTFVKLDSTGSAITISADGSKIVFSATKGDKNMIFRRDIGEFGAEPIAGTENGVAPFISRDGRWVGFAVGHEVKRVPYSGGSGTEATMLPPLMSIDFMFQGGDFDSDGNPIIGQCSRGLRSVAMSSGGRSIMTDVHDKEATGHHVFPSILPGGDQLLFTRVGPQAVDIWLLNRVTGQKKKLIASGGCARYLSPGYIVFVRGGDLYAVPFDLKTGTVQGAEVKVVGGLMGQSVLGLAHWSVSDNGTLVYVPGLSTSESWAQAWVDMSGRTQPVPEPQADPLGVGFHVSPDGTRALESRGWIMDETYMGIREFGRNIWRKISPGHGSAYWAVWSPDGRNIVYQQDVALASGEGAPTGLAGMKLNLFLVPADLSSPPQRLTTYHRWQHPSSFSPDGRTLAFVQGYQDPATNEIWMLPMDTRRPYPFVASGKGDTHPVFSPDGRWLAYTSGESGHWEVMVRPFPGPGGATQVSTEGGWEPIWSPDGRRIYYRTLDGSVILSAAFTAGAPLRVEKPQTVVKGHYWPGNGYGRFYDLAPDGKRFLVILGPDPVQPVSQYVVVLNWVEELKRLVPLKN